MKFSVRGRRKPSRHSIAYGRDVIHGFKTVLPIPIGQAASWNRDLVEAGARISALEAARAGVNWTFAPMLDIARDPRWGRVAESFGEDPFLASVLGSAMVVDFRDSRSGTTDPLRPVPSILPVTAQQKAGGTTPRPIFPKMSCAMCYLQPFHAAVTAGAATVMTSFGDLNGIPCTANGFYCGRYCGRNGVSPGLLSVTGTLYFISRFMA